MITQVTKRERLRPRSALASSATPRTGGRQRPAIALSQRPTANGSHFGPDDEWLPHHLAYL